MIRREREGAGSGDEMVFGRRLKGGGRRERMGQISLIHVDKRR